MNFASTSNEIQLIEDFPLSPQYLQIKQTEDSDILQIIDYPDFIFKSVEQHELIATSPLQQIVVPKSETRRIITWYHENLFHPRITRMYNVIKCYFWWSGMKNEVAEYIRKCKECQLNKKNRKQYGKLETTDIDQNVSKFEVIVIDICGPLPVCKVDKRKHKHFMTIIDVATRWIEIIPVLDTKSKTLCKVVDDWWQSGYPRPEVLLSDKGQRQ
eukprot:NODE_83_length_22457_cov_0.375794.p6 type:complete len:214 gc:universal NODE_83_length_22457_cov_0.375794:6623-5982(-)